MAQDQTSLFGAGVRTVLPPRELASDLLNAVQAATLVASSSLVEDHVDWCEAVLAARDLPVSDVATCCLLVRDVLPATAPLAREMADAAHAACTRSGT
jgi:hypothetical protein